MIKHYWSAILIFALFILSSCNEESSLEKEISKIPVDFNIERFDKVFAEADPNDLNIIKNDFPFLFSSMIPDSVWKARMRDTLQQELFAEVGSRFESTSDLDTEINRLFQHLNYYDKSFKPPRVITVTNDVDYRNKIIVTDTITLIALDNYLGNDHRFYQNIPMYLTANMKQDQVVVDLCGAYAEKYIFQMNQKTFLDQMIYFGKTLYFKDKMIPFKEDAEKMGYTLEQLNWAKANESAIWSYFVEKELLFSTDQSLTSRFISPAPFSKFYLEFDNESPGRLGQYMGWQIVRAYAQNNDIGLLDLMKEEPMSIFEKSKFKPQK